MDKIKWLYLNNGISERRIARKKLVNKDVRGIFNIVELLPKLKEDEFMIIPVNQQLYPFFRGWEMTSRDFKKRGNQFNLRLGTMDEMIEGQITPQKAILESVEQAYRGVSFFKELRYEDILRNQEIYKEICRRGFKWTRASTSDHAIISERDLSRGWRLASLIIAQDMDLAYSNPGDIFFIQIPSAKKDPKYYRYPTKVRGFVTKLPGGYFDWRLLDGNSGSIEDEFEKAIKGTDVYSAASLRYKMEEFRLDFHLIAAAILRQHYNDYRLSQYKFKNLKRVAYQEINPVLLNLTIPPKRDRIRLDWILDNNVLLEYKTKKGDLEYKKLNMAERELVFCADTYLQFLRGESPFYRDDGLQSLDEVVRNHKEVIGF